MSAFLRRAFLLLFGLLFMTLIKAQKFDLDSIRLAIDTISNDSSRATAYLRAFKPLLFSDGEFAMELADSGLQISKRIGLKSIEGESYRLQGVYYMINGATPLALENYQRAYDLFEQLGNITSMLKSANNFATVYMEMEQWDTALTYIASHESYKPTTASDSLLVATMEHNRGICLDMKGQNQAAYEIFSNNLQIFQKIEAEHEQSMSLSSLGELANEMNQPAVAIQHLRKAEALKRKLDDSRGLSLVLIKLAISYNMLGQADSAITIGNRSLDLAVLHKNFAQESAIQQEFAKIYAQLGQYAKAYQALNRHVVLDDSLKKDETRAQLLNMQAAYGIKSKNHEINELQQANALDQANLAQQRLLIFSMLGLIAVVLIGFALLYRANLVRKKLSKAISDQNEALEQSNLDLQKSIDERQALLHMIIHDLKSPLTVTEALNNAMRTLDDMPEMALQITEKVNLANRRGMQLITDLLALYEMEGQSNFEQSTVNCGEVVENLLKSMEAQAAQKGITLQLEPYDGTLRLHTNASKLSRILENLVSNAIKFSPMGSQVKLSLIENNGKIRLAVQDQGPGISQEDQAQLFQKFKKLSARPTAGEHSNGLGLAIVKQLSEQLGATIGLQSALEKGATFWVEFPKA